jgi:hypothetical protein
MDRVWITCFESSYQDFSDSPMLRDEMLADPAFQNFDQIDPQGGTELLPALEHVLAVRAKHSRGVPSRLIVITDGQVGNEESILELMRGVKAAKLPVHTFGIDSAVNDAFLQQLAAETGGRCTLMTPQDDIPEAVRKLACTLRRPVLTNLKLPKGVEVPSPERGLMDLHAGEVLLIPLRVKGLSLVKLTASQPDGRSWSMKWDLDQAEESETARLTWAKRRIKNLQQQGEQTESVELAIQHNLICKGTAFVSWDEEAKTTIAEQAVVQPSLAPPSTASVVYSSGSVHRQIRHSLAMPMRMPPAPRPARSAPQDQLMSFMPLAQCFVPATSSPRSRHSRQNPPPSSSSVPADSWVKSLRQTLEKKFHLPHSINLQLYLALLQWAEQILGGQRHKLLETWAEQLAQPDSSLDQLESLLDSIQDEGVHVMLEHLREWRAEQHA